jgi:hypothetical protein
MHCRENDLSQVQQPLSERWEEASKIQISADMDFVTVLPGTDNNNESYFT